uniref:AC transposase n=1 Tax=Cajanus cajan TaxID=3821 RepID=A0A151RH70_CAJCA|nr:hypothetical protein KK1_036788 [Cajanus cajan]
MRCCAHILSLIMKDGLKEIKDSILKIRNAVKYVKSSLARFSRFKACVEQEGISYKGLYFRPGQFQGSTGTIHHILDSGGAARG